MPKDPTIKQQIQEIFTGLQKEQKRLDENRKKLQKSLKPWSPKLPKDPEDPESTSEPDIPAALNGIASNLSHIIQATRDIVAMQQHFERMIYGILPVFLDAMDKEEANKKK